MASRIPLTRRQLSLPFISQAANREEEGKNNLIARRNRRRRRRLTAGNKSLQSGLGLSEQMANKTRLYLVWIILMLGGLGLVVNLYRLQVIQSQDLRERAQAQQQVAPSRIIPRRALVDRNGNILAIDQQVYTLYAHPYMFKKPPGEIAAKLASILHRPAPELLLKFKEAKSGIRIAERLPPKVGERIKDLMIDGLELVETTSRIYPYQELAAEVIGYVDLDNQPQAGLEYSQKNLIERTPSSDSNNQQPGGFTRIDDLRLQLTLDTRLQMAARSALKQKIQEYKAKRGGAIIMDARDGSLLALVQEPSYDPNQYYKFDLERFKNWLLTDTYEPGSTFKPITVAIALEAGAIQPDSVFNDEGLIYVDGWPIANADYEYAGSRGAISLTEILQYSSNVGMVHIALRLQPSLFYSWLERIGLGQPVDIDLPFATASYIKSKKEFTASPINPATTAFGQGFTITPIQLLQLYGAIANQGKLVKPHVVRGLYNSQGQLYWQPQPSLPQQIFSPKTTSQIIAMMEKAVSNGTGKAAQISGYRIAGKTGTAQKASAAGGYSDYAKIVSFVGILPAEAPRYVVLVVVDEPQGGSGGLVAAPIVKSIMEALIVSEGIFPSQELAPSN